MLTAERREELAIWIRRDAIACAVGVAEVEEIDTVNILQATLLAMRRAVDALQPAAEFALVDGNLLPPTADRRARHHRRRRLEPASPPHRSWRRPRATR